MFLQKLFASIVVCSLLVVQVFAQQKSISQTKSDEISPALKKEAVALLRETIKDISNLKLAENRQYFSISAADLLWDYDEKESRAMFQTEMNDLRQSLAQTAAAIAESESKSGERFPVYPNSGAYSSYIDLDPKLTLQMKKVLTMRGYLIYVMAENNPQMADDFLRETAQINAGSKYKSIFGDWDNILERQIATQFVKKDADKAADIARRLLAKGFSTQIIDILDEIYKQSANKGNQLAEEILQKLKASNPPKNNSESYDRIGFATQFFKKAVASLEQTKPKPDKKPLLGENSVRELADYVGQISMNESLLGYAAKDSETAAAIEKYAPERAAQMREKQRRIREKSGNAVVVNSNVAVAANSNMMTANANIAAQTPAQVKSYQDQMREYAEKQKQIKAERETVSEKLKQKNLSAEDKTFVLAQIRKFASEPKERDDKIKVFAYWATESAEDEDSEMAETLMREAESLATPQTKNYRDYMSNWWLANGYSAIAPEKSFTILERTIPPLNDVISGFAKIAEFMDDGGNIIFDGEVSMVGTGTPIGGGAQFFGALQGSQRVARNLAKADFARTKNLTDKFERPEFRALSRLLVLRSLLKPQEEASAETAREVSGSH
ncbi:MAG: hypothetical protein ACR2N3_08300 [Pyrinomonadaceae bacterium]